MSEAERHAQATATYRAAKELREKYPINDRSTGKNSPILVELNHVGKPIETGDDEQPQTETARRNAATVEAWRHSSARNGVESGEITAEYQCIHCDEYDDVAGHWERCEKHPARVMVADLRHRLEIAEAGWTKARMDTDAMTREIEGLKSSVGALLDAMRLERREEDGVTTIWADYIDDSLIADVVRRLKGGEVAG